MNSSRWLILSALYLGSLVPAWAGDAGTDSALNLGAGAGSIAMGRSGVTESGTVFAADWNPAGLASVPRCQFSLQHTALYADTIHDVFGFVYPLLDWGGIALTLVRIQSAGVDGRDMDNLPTGILDFVEQQAALSYGADVWGPLSAGVTVNLHQLSLGGSRGYAPRADLGLLARLIGTESAPFPSLLGLQDLAVGASLRNVWSPGLTLQSDADRLAPVYRIGTAFTWMLNAASSTRLQVRSDLEKPELGAWRIHAGLECSLFDLLALRGGWDHEYPSAGVGLSWSGLALDYAVSFPVIGPRHLMTLSYAFGEDVQAQKKRRLADEEHQRKAVVESLKQDIILGYENKAKEFLAQRNYGESLKYWEKVLDWDPSNVEIQEQVKAVQATLRDQEVRSILVKAQSSYRDKQYIDTMVFCRQVLDLEPNHTEALALHTQAEKDATRLGDATMAREAKAQVRIRENYLKGLQAYSRRNWKEAVSHWEQVIGESPLQKQVYQYLEKAHANLESTEVANPEQASKAQLQKQLYREAAELSRAGKLADATNKWEKILQENPQDEDAKTNLEKTRQDLIKSQKRGLRW